MWTQTRDAEEDPVDHTPMPETFAEFYRREYKPVLGITVALSGSRSAAEALAQDAFVVAHGRWSEVQSHPNPAAWIRRVAINNAFGWRRKRVAEAKALARLGRERQRLQELPALPDQIWAEVRRLPRNQAIAVTLRYHDDRSLSDIAEILGCGEPTVRVHLHRGRKTLATALDLELASEKEEDL